MSLEIQSVVDARQRIKILYGEIPFIDEFAKIAHYLSTAEPIRQLELVSADVWAAYNDPREIGDLDSRNRFTRAILACGRKVGFKYNLHFVYGAALTEQAFMNNVAQGILWKDSFAPEHGEFSHTFQWLAIAKKFGFGARTATLYKSTVPKAIFKIKTRVGNAIGGVRQPFWSWLVDCFPTGSYSASIRSTNIAHEFSDTYRCPNNVHRALILNTHWFLGHYVKYRQYKTLRAVNDLRQGPLKDRNSKYFSPPYNSNARKKIKRNQMEAIQEITVGHHTNTVYGWQQPSKEIGIFTKSATVLRKHGKQQIPKIFHARRGHVSIGKSWSQLDRKTQINKP